MIRRYPSFAPQLFKGRSEAVRTVYDAVCHPLGGLTVGRLNVGWAGSGLQTGLNTELL